MQTRIVALILPLIVLSACDRRPAPSSDGDAVQRRAVQQQRGAGRTGAEIQETAMTRTVRTVYICENAQRLTVDFDNPRQMATVRRSDGLAVDLFHQRTASGIWYRAGDVELRGAGRKATWREGEAAPTECRAID